MASLYKRSGSYYLDWRDSKGRHQKSLGRISEHLAKVKLKQKEYELTAGIERSIGNVILFKDYVNEYMPWYENNYPSSYNAKTYQVTSLSFLFDQIPLNKISIEDIEKYKNIRSKTVRPATINRELSTLSAMLNKARESGYFVANIKIKKAQELESRPPKFYSLDELEDIFNADQSNSHWWRFLANTGLRLGEFYNLKSEDIYNNSIHIVSTSKRRTKSKNWRLVPLSDKAMQTLEHFDLTQEYVLPRIRKDSVQTKYRRICEKAKINKSKRGIHCLRHTFASHLIMSGKPLRVVQQLLGHANMKTTEQYAHLSPEYLQDSMKDFSL